MPGDYPAWIGDWQFMERGRRVELNGASDRIRWLEHTARKNNGGDLYSARLDTHAALTLARNVFDYQESADGRVIAAANQAFSGAQNRIVIVDEQRATARWVADGAYRFQTIPGTTDLLVHLVGGDDEVDVVRVPLPLP